MNIGKIVSSVALATILLVGGAGIASAQTTTPGVPNTGAGGDVAMNLLLLGVAAIVAIAGGTYLSRKFAERKE